MTRHRTALNLLGILTAAAALVAASTSPASARIVDGGSFHDVFTGTDPNFCDSGLAVGFVATVDGRFRVNERGPNGGYYMENVRVVNVFTAPNGKTATDIQPNTLNKDLSITDNGNGTITVIVLATGGARTYGDAGKLIAKNSGQVRFRIVYDYVNDVEISNELVFGSTGTNDDFCEAVLSDWGYL